MTEQMKQSLKPVFEANLEENKDEIVSVYDRYAGLVDGADIYRNNVWHDASKERPENGRMVLVIGGKKVGLVRKVYRNNGGVGDHCRWAYIDDLLPDRKEDEA